MATLTADELRSVLAYDAETGVFTWRAKPSPRIHAGAVAGTISARGYRIIKVGGTYRRAHRLAWLYVHGEWPAGEVDHINGERDDNWIANLRVADRTLNAQNKRKASRNKQSCDVLGVFPQSNGHWIARLNVGGKRMNLGTYATTELAHAAYVAAKREMHPGCTI